MLGSSFGSWRESEMPPLLPLHSIQSAPGAPPQAAPGIAFWMYCLAKLVSPGWRGPLLGELENTLAKPLRATASEKPRKALISLQIP